MQGEVRFSGNWVQEIPAALYDLHLRVFWIGVPMALLWVGAIYLTYRKSTRKWGWVALVIMVLLEVLLVQNIIFDM